MIERELLGVQQRPEQIAEHLVAGRRRASALLHRRPLASRRRPRQRRQEQLLDRLASSALAVLEQLRQPAVAGARSSRTTLSPFCRCSSCGIVTSPLRSQAQAVTRSDRPNSVRKYDFSAGSGSWTARMPDRVAGEAVRHAGRLARGRRAAPRPAAGGRSSASRSACPSRCRAGSPRRAGRSAS